MARMKTMKSIDEKILECEEKLRKLKVRCDKMADELDSLYAEKKRAGGKRATGGHCKKFKNKSRNPGIPGKCLNGYAIVHSSE